MSISEDLKNMGIINLNSIKRNFSTPALYDEMIKNEEGILAHLGPVVVKSGKYTGRVPDFRFVVKQKPSENFVWWGRENKPIDSDSFELLYNRVCAYLQKKNIYVMDGYANAHLEYRIPIRVISRWAWHSLFARNMFIRELDKRKLSKFKPQLTLIVLPEFNAIPKIDKTASEAFVLLNLEKGLILIGGTGYAGEIKKAVFSTMNYYLPKKGVLTMHSSANMGEKGDTAVFFGLSGTGKTTLSSDPDRFLIGDDEHGWGKDGVFNLEGGCYAKVIRLSKEDEPLIYQTTRRFGTILENVIIDKDTRRIFLDDDSITQNTRASYPITHIPNYAQNSTGGHPKNIIMLTYDAFGVLPPVSRLTKDQAMYHFLSGYTAKVAGTESGIVEPTATFSPCFGSPFMTLNPAVYAKMLGEKIQKHNVNCWLVNTGYTGGNYERGKRISISHTRAIIKAILNDSLLDVEYEQLPIFKLYFPKQCPDVDSTILNPKNTWSDKKLYDKQLRDLHQAFRNNFEEFSDYIDYEIKDI